MEDLITIHHELGHIQYYQQYKSQPTLYRDGANPGFHEAIGDVLALSVATPKYLKKIGLLQIDDNPELLSKINIKFQMKMALDKFVFLPFGYLMDKWRWDVFSGKVSANDLNHHWWKLRGELQGVSPPVKRSENDFDVGSKYHISASLEYIRKMLEKGSSEKWTKQLKDFVGTERMDVKPLLEYFEPLNEFLDQQLKGQDIGWKFNVDDYFTPNSGNTPKWGTYRYRSKY